MFFIELFIVLITFIYLAIKYHYGKWQRLDIPYDEPRIPYGSLLRVQRKELHFAVALADIYEQFHHERFVGIFLFFKPVILVRDVQLARQILTSDFVHFHDRGVYVDEKHDPMTVNLFGLKGDLWRNLRAKLAPSFSTGKLKGMFEAVNDVAEKAIAFTNKQLENGNAQSLDIKSISLTYAIDIVGSVMFGLDIDSFAFPNNEFRQVADRLYNEKNILKNLRVIMTFLCPTLALLLSRLGVKDPFTTSLRVFVKRTIEYREKNEVVRKDLLQSLIQLQSTGKISDDHDKTEALSRNSNSKTIDMIAANLCLFYLAGTETTSATISFALYELAMCPRILEKVQMEVDECLVKNNLKPQDPLTYEAVQDMKYLDLCILETTRKYPAAAFLNRECNRDYKIPRSDVTIKKGTAIIISLLGIHRDEKHFPNPMVYKPERFSKDKPDYQPDAFMPFGLGPRQCIAQRMGILNIKVILAKTLANFHIKPMERKEVEFKYHNVPILVPKQKLQISLTKRF